MLKATRLIKVKIVASSIVFALIHYSAFSVGYVRSEVVHSVQDHGPWRIALVVLGFPFGHPLKGPLHVDIFPIAITLNSLLWGAACTATVLGFMRLARGRFDRMQAH